MIRTGYCICVVVHLHLNCLLNLSAAYYVQALGAVIAALPAGTNLTNPAVVQILLAHVARGEIKVIGNKVVNTGNKGHRNRNNNITTLNGVITFLGRNNRK